MHHIPTTSFTWGLIVLLCAAPMAMASHQGHEGHEIIERMDEGLSDGYSIPGVPFRVFVRHTQVAGQEEVIDPAVTQAALHTVVDVFRSLVRNRTQYQRFDEAVTKEVLQAVILEPRVLNRDGKEFPFLVARTKTPGKVKLLVSVSAMKNNGYLNHPQKLVPVLAREFQWVVSKSATKPKRRNSLMKRDVSHAPILKNKEILKMSGEERVQVLQALFRTYLTTVDEFQSLKGEPYYEVGKTTLIQPTQPDSTIKLYDIRVREALQLIVQDPDFQEQTPKAVRSLLNGKIWNVAFVKIDQRDWATRTRVLPKDKAVEVGIGKKRIQPAKILVNYHRTAAPEDPFYRETHGMPMGALSPRQLARVIALEIEHNIIDKSMTGHVAEDEKTAPK